MLRRINVYLAGVAVLGAIFCGAMFAYTHMAKLENTKIVKQLEGEA